MANEVEGRRAKRRRKTGGNAKLLKGEKVEVRFVEDGLKGSWHAATVLECGECSRLVEFDEIMDEDDSTKLVEDITVSTAVEGITCTVRGSYRGNIRPLLSLCRIDQADAGYGSCVDAYVDDAWWEGVIFDHEEASPSRLVFFPDEGDQQIVPVSQLRLSQDWDEVSGAWSPRGTWLFLELLRNLELGEPLPVSVRQIWYDVRSHSSFAEMIGDWVFGTWPSWQELVSCVIDEILSVIFGLTVPPRLVDLSSGVDGNCTPTVPLPYSGVNNLCPGEADFAVAGQSTGLSGMLGRSPSAFSGRSCSMVYEDPCADNCLAAPIRREKLGQSSQALLDFIYEHHRRKFSCVPESRKRYKLLRDAAMHHLLAVGWKFKRSRSGVKLYVSPREGRYFSFVKACKACEATERLGLRNCNGGDENVLCAIKCSVRNVHTTDKVEDAHKISRNVQSWQPLGLEPEYCPEAVALCAPTIFRRIHENKVFDNRGHADAKRMLRKHLLALGWRVEAKQGSFRYYSPEGKSFYSLQRICREVAEGLERKSLSSRKDITINESVSRGRSESLLTVGRRGRTATVYPAKDGLRNCIKTARSSEMIGFNNIVYAVKASCSDTIKQNLNAANGRERYLRKNGSSYVSDEESPLHGVLHPEYDPEVIGDYIRHDESTQSICKRGNVCVDDNDTGDIRLKREKVRKHLLAEGWTIWTRRTQNKKEKCYRSPKGRNYYSLRNACKAYMECRHLQISAVSSDGCLLKTKRYKGLSAVAYPSQYDKNGSQSTACSSSMGGQHGPKQETLYFSHKREKCDSKIFSRSSHSGKLQNFVINSKGVDKTRNTKQRTTFPSSPLLCHKVKKQSYAKERDNCKSGNRKSSQPLIKQCDISRSGFTQGGRQLIASSAGQHVSRTILSLLIENSVVLPRQKVYYKRQRDGQVMKEGRITRDGIKCSCCNGLFAISEFEAHAGSSKHRPAANIFLQDGRTLLQCKAQIRERNKPKEFTHKRKKKDCSSIESDSICSACQDGGSLVLCDHCPSSFHLTCVGLKEVPEGKWFCPSCRCGICGLSGFNSNSEFSETTVLYCDQCEREFHVGCLRENGLAGLESCPKGNWFCSGDCSKIFMHLHRHLGKINPTAVVGLSWTILRSRKESDPSPDENDMDTIIEHHCKLSVATDVMHECFEPISDPRSNSDLVTDIIFNKESDLKRLNFWGFYTMLLQRGDELISVAAFRVFGGKVAEMPLVATRVQYRRKGMCRLLMDELEKLLFSLGVERLLLPAIPQLLQTWTGSFGFSTMSLLERLTLLEYPLLSFQDTTMCQKLLRRSHSTLKPPKGSNDILLKIPNGEMDCPNNVTSGVVEAVEPTKSLLSSAEEEPRPMATECPSFDEDNQAFDPECRFAGKCYVRCKDRKGREWSRNSIYARFRGIFTDGKFKHFYKRRVQASW